MVGMIAGFALILYLRLGARISFPWYVALGSLCTFLVGYGASLAMPAAEKKSA